jgi:hypothetical protein
VTIPEAWGAGAIMVTSIGAFAGVMLAMILKGIE